MFALQRFFVTGEIIDTVDRWVKDHTTRPEVLRNRCTITLLDDVEAWAKEQDYDSVVAYCTKKRKEISAKNRRILEMLNSLPG